MAVAERVAGRLDAGRVRLPDDMVEHIVYGATLARGEAGQPGRGDVGARIEQLVVRGEPAGGPAEQIVDRGQLGPSRVPRSSRIAYRSASSRISSSWSSVIS